MKHIEQLKLEEFSYSPSRSWKASHWRKTMIFFRKSLIPEVQSFFVKKNRSL